MTSLVLAMLFILAFMSTLDSRFALEFLKSLVAVMIALVAASLVRVVSQSSLFPGDQQIGFAVGFALALFMSARLGLGLPRLIPGLLALWFVLEVLALRYLGRPASFSDYIDQRVGGYFAALLAIWPLVGLGGRLGKRRKVEAASVSAVRNEGRRRGCQ